MQSVLVFWIEPPSSTGSLTPKMYEQLLTCASMFDEVIRLETSVAKPGHRQLFASSPYKVAHSSEKTIKKNSVLSLQYFTLRHFQHLFWYKKRIKWNQPALARLCKLSGSSWSRSTNAESGSCSWPAPLDRQRDLLTPIVVDIARGRWRSGPSLGNVWLSETLQSPSLDTELASQCIKFAVDTGPSVTWISCMMINISLSAFIRTYLPLSNWVWYNIYYLGKEMKTDSSSTKIQNRADCNVNATKGAFTHNKLAGNLCLLTLLNRI